MLGVLDDGEEGLRIERANRTVIGVCVLARVHWDME
jgi:hypothetical protein